MALSPGVDDFFWRGHFGYVDDEFGGRQFQGPGYFFRHGDGGGDDHDLAGSGLLQKRPDGLSVVRELKERSPYGPDKVPFRFGALPGHYSALRDHEPVVDQEIHFIFLGHHLGSLAFSRTGRPHKGDDAETSRGSGLHHIRPQGNISRGRVLETRVSAAESRRTPPGVFLSSVAVT